MSPAVVSYTSAADWDALVDQYPSGHFLQSWAWGELKGEFGWRPVRLAVLDDQGRPAAAAQLLIRRVLGLAVCYVPRGPLLSGRAELDRVLLAALRRVALRNRAAFLRLEPNVLAHEPHATTLNSRLQVAGFRQAEPLQPGTSIHLDLQPDPDQLFAAFSKGHRADVRRAERQGVSVRVGASVADLDAFYAIMEATAARAEFAIHSREYHLRAWQIAGEAARLLIASDKAGADIAAFLVFGWGREAQYMYSGATAQGLKLGANHLLQWHALQWARERGCTLYDFWGVPEAAAKLAGAAEAERAAVEAELQADPLAGVYRFKKGWGGQVVTYLPAYDQVYFPPAYWLWRERGGGG